MTTLKRCYLYNKDKGLQDSGETNYSIWVRNGSTDQETGSRAGIHGIEDQDWRTEDEELNMRGTDMVRQ